MGRTSNIKVLTSCHGDIVPGRYWMSIFLLVFSVPHVLSQTSAPGNPIISSPNVSTVTEHALITFRCQSVGGNPTPTVIWYRNDTQVDDVYSTSSVGGTQVTANTYTKNMLFTDTGVPFTCKVSNAVTPTKEISWIFDRIQVTPSQPVLSGPSDLTVGETSQFNCTVSRYFPANMIEWKLDGNRLGFGIISDAGTNADQTYYRYSILNYVPVLADNGKILRCEFTSNNVIYFEEKQLTVTAPPPFVHVATTLYSRSSGSVTLQCTVTGATTVTWYRNGAILTTTTSEYSGGTVSNPSLTINSVSNVHSGNYTCSGTSSGGTRNSTSIQFIFGDLPVVTTSQSSYSSVLGNSVTLQCIVSGTPAISDVIWEKNINGIWTELTVDNLNYGGGSVQSPSLIIYTVESADEGYYKCKARNSLGMSESGQIYLYITGSVPTFTLMNTAYVVTYGSSKTLQCSVSGTPAVNSVSWQRVINGVRSTVNIDGVNYGGATLSFPSLIVYNAETGDEGYYICTATNSVGTGESDEIYLSVVGNVPTISLAQRSYSITTGTTLTLQCSVSGVPAVTDVTWKRQFNGATSTITIDNVNYGGASLSSPSLTIYNADSADEGTYVCTASNIVGTAQSDLISLTVTGNVPTVTVTQTAYSVTTASSVTLQCTVSGTPEVTAVYWQRTVNGVTSVVTIDNVNYSGSSVTSPSLTISSADSNDAGTYYCVAVNSVGTTQSNQISVAVTGDLPAVTINQASYSSTVGSTVRLLCSYAGSPQVTSIAWQKIVNGVASEVSIDGSKYSGATIFSPSLVIYNVNSGDSATYRCLATNSVGTGRSDEISLTVTGNVPTVTEGLSSYSVTTGTSVTLQCSYSGTPTVTSISWQKNINGAISTVVIDGTKYEGSSVSSPSLTIYNTDPGDTGTYTCFASNSVGTGQSSPISLSVIGSIPAVNVAQTLYSVNFGSSITLKCSYSGTPQVTDVFWEKIVGGVATTLNVNGADFGGSTLSSPSLTVYNADKSDEASYRCLATNAVGTGESSLVALYVTGNIPTVSIAQSTYSVTTGQTATLQCSYSGNPSVSSVYWRRTVNGVTSTITADGSNYGGSSLNSPSLIIYNTDTGDSGTYVCYAVNIVGTGQSSDVTLSVTGSIPTVSVAQSTYSVTTGQTATLQCSYSGNPSVSSVYWQRTVNGVTSTITADGSNYGGSSLNSPSLIIYNTDTGDSGTYVCYAVNIVGTGQSSAVTLSVTGSIPTVSVAQSTYSVTTGQTATLQCSYSGNPSVSSVYWQRIVNGVTSTITADGSNYGGSSLNSPSLIIYNTDTGDSGTYVCYAVNVVGTGQSSAVTLSVTGSIPTVSIAQSTYSVTTGQTATLQCSYSGNPSVSSVYWQRTVNGVTSTITADGSNYGGSSLNSPSLIIYNTDTGDSGTYVCYAVNIVGTGQSSDVTLSVTGSIPTVSIAQSTYSVTTGQTATLQCSYSGNPSISSVYWRRTVNGVNSTITADGSNYGGSSLSSPSLIIYNTDTGDSGTYVCYAVNIVGTGQSSAVTLSVTGSVPTVSVAQSTYSVTTGQTATLQCSYSGNPDVNSVYWQRTVNGVTSTITADGSNYGGSSLNSPSLIIYNTDTGDSGTYVCYAVNIVGTGQSSAVTLSVTGSVPTVSVAQSTYSVTTGQTATLQCSYSGNPDVNSVYWQRTVNGVTSTITADGSNYGGSSLNSPSLIIYNTDTGDSGTYVCYAVNIVGTGQSSVVTLSVTGSIPTVSIAQSTYSVTTGQTATLQCSYSGNPSVSSVYWQRTVNGVTSTITADGSNYGGSSLNSPSLIIYNTDTGDSGTYVCYAVNIVGTGQSSAVTLSVTGSVPTVSVAQSIYSVTTGQTATLQCSYSGTPSVSSVYWQRTVNGVTSTITADGSNYGGSSLNSPSLIIYNTDTGDSGTYVCYAVNIVGTGQSSAVTLSVTGSIPTVTIAQGSYSVVTGQPVTLQCSYSGNPTVTSVSWQKNINGVTSTVTIDGSNYGGSSVNSPSLIIYNADPSDSGTYTCYATNIVGTGQGSFITLSVTGDIPTVTVAQTTYSVTTGSSVTLQCSYSATPQVTNVVWQKITNGAASTLFLTADMAGATVASPSLVFLTASTSDTGSYRCLATNSVGTGQSDVVYLTVTGSLPSVSVTQTTYSVTTGSTITLQCSVTASPQANSIYWQKIVNGVATTLTIDGVNYGGSSTSSPSLLIFNVDQSDEGTYKCIATNSVGTGEGSEISLAVTGSVPVVSVAQASYSVSTGITVTLVCTVTASPAATSVTWVKISGGTTTTITTDGTNYGGAAVDSPSLIIYNADSSDSASYKCSASNSVGTGESTQVTLFVTGNLPSVSIPLTSYSVTLGNSVTIPCTATGTPTPTAISWTRTSGQVTNTLNIDGITYSGATVNSPSLVILSSKTSDQGYYTCRATNAVGTADSNSAYLYVTGNIPTVTISQASYAVLTGSSVTLSCVVVADPTATSVSWQRIINGVAVSVTTDTSKYSGGTVSTPSLTINDARSSDQGDYYCLATNEAGTGLSGQTYLSVTGNIPVVTISQNSYSVTTGSSITLGCTFTATPSATDVDWLKISGGVTSTVVINNSKFSGSSLTTPSLTITNAQEEDEGYYVCKVTNAVGPGQSIQAYLSVSGNIPTVNIGQSTYSITTGMDVTLTCTATAIPAITSVTWKRSTTSGGSTTTLIIDGVKFGGATVNDPSLTIFNSASTDVGFYTCTAANSLGAGSSAESYLLVSGNKPVISVIQTSYSGTTGQSVTLQCSVSGNPAVSGVAWKRTINGQTSVVAIDGTKFKGSLVSAPSLVISNIDANDQGTYMCTATNVVGTTESSGISLAVSGSVPSVTVSQTSYSVITGQSVTLQCSVTAVPAHTSVTWQRTINGVQSSVNIDGTSYTGSSVGSPSLTIDSVSGSDAGTYVCRASNVVGTGSSVPVTLSVSGYVPTVTVATSSYDVITSNTVTMECIVNAIPAANLIRWEKSVNSVTTPITVDGSKYGGGAVNSPSLVINNADSNDIAFYTCTATNIVGTGRSQQTYLSVSGSLPTVTIGQTTYTVTKGSSIVLQCTVSASPAHTQVTWERLSGGITTTITIDGSLYLGSSVSNPSLTISSAGSADAGVYVCKATNQVGMGESARATLSVVGDIPTVEILQSSYNVTTAVSVTLECTVSATPNATSVFWQRIINQVTTTVQIDGVHYLGGSVNTPSLTINSPAAGDQGHYVCSASNIVGTGHSGQTYLRISGSIPSVIVPDSTYTVVTGSNVTIPCTVTSTPAASAISWKHIVNGVSTTITINGSKYTGGSVTTPSLTISNTDNSDQGFYVCSATNIVGNGQSGQTYLTVTGNVPAVTISKSSYSVVVGNLVTIECVVIATPGHTSVSWERMVNGITTTMSIDGTTYQGGSVSSPSLIITSASVRDQGSYVCSAMNSVGIGKSGQSILFVTGNVPTVSIGNTSYSVVIGNTVTITCSITASTPAATSISWQKIESGVTTDLAINGAKYSGGTLQSPSLTISNAQLSDQAYYRCRAGNVVGTGESSQSYLYVTGNIPTLTIPQSSYTVSIGNPVTLSCTVSSVPDAQSVSWEFTNTNGVTSVVNTNGVDYTGATLNSPSLSIAVVTSSDQGAYYCKATNEVGTGTSSQIYLYVTGGIPTVVLSNTTFGFLLGTQATLGCRVAGTPAITNVFWQKVPASGSGITLQGARYSTTSKDSPDLRISNIAESDAGNYRCHAVNSIGEGKSALGLLVIHYAPRNTRITQASPVVVVENNAFTLTCSSTASPAATYVWRRGNVNVGETANYVISAADRGHAGTYTCEAMNNYGSGTATIVVNVQFRPVSQVTDGSVIISLGGTRILSCQTLSNPGVTSYEWRKNNDVLTDRTTKNISITINSASDYGTYSCYATNDIGTSAAISYSVQSAGTTVSAVTPGVGASVTDTGLTSGEIAAIILSILFLLLLLLLILYCCISHGICACCRKEKQKGTVVPSPEKPKQIIRTIEIPRYVEKTYSEKPYYYSREPSSAAVSRQDVFIQEENFEISRYQMVPPAGTIDGGTIISMQSDGRTPRPHHLPALDYNHVNEEEGLKKKRRRKKKRRHHRERSEKYHSPRKDGEEVILASTNHYDDPDDIEVHAGKAYYS